MTDPDLVTGWHTHLLQRIENVSAEYARVAHGGWASIDPTGEFPEETHQAWQETLEILDIRLEEAESAALKAGLPPAAIEDVRAPSLRGTGSPPHTEPAAPEPTDNTVDPTPKSEITAAVEAALPHTNPTWTSAAEPTTGASTPSQHPDLGPDP